LKEFPATHFRLANGRLIKEEIIGGKEIIL